MSDQDAGTEEHPSSKSLTGIGGLKRRLRARASDAGRRYNSFLGSIGGRVAKTVSKGAHGIDSAVGDIPWRLGGFDERKTRIARGVLKEVVPKAAGDRVASMVDGVAIKAGAGGLGIALRLPLKPIIGPVLLVLGAVETVRAVRDIRKGVADVADRIDGEIAAENARDGMPQLPRRETLPE